MSCRCLVDPLPGEGLVFLPAGVSRHLGRVRRARPGDEVVLFDGRGRECAARVRAVRGGEVQVEVGPARAIGREPRARVQLAFALPKAARAEWLFEHATEVGVAVLRPVLCERGGPPPRRTDRWRRIAASAAAQCGRSLLPRVCDPEALADLLARDDLPAERYCARLGAPALDAARGDEALLFVGPPGGLSAAEEELLAGEGFLPRGLGPLVLRTETAVLVGAARLLAE